MMGFDFIVVGAGSTAARESALRGLSVLMLDSAEIPRNKPREGGITVRSANFLDIC